MRRLQNKVWNYEKIRKHGYCLDIEEVNQKYKLRANERVILLELLHCSRDRTYASVPHQVLAKKCLISRLTVIRTVDKLRKKGAIRVLDFTEAEKIRQHLPKLKTETKPAYKKKPNVYELLAFAELVEEAGVDYKNILSQLLYGQNFEFQDGYFLRYRIEDLASIKDTWKITIEFQLVKELYKRLKDWKFEGKQLKVRNEDIKSLNYILAAFLFNKQTDELFLELLELRKTIESKLESKEIVLVDSRGLAYDEIIAAKEYGQQVRKSSSWVETDTEEKIVEVD